MQHNQIKVHEWLNIEGCSLTWCRKPQNVSWGGAIGLKAVHSRKVFTIWGGFGQRVSTNPRHGGQGIH